MVIYTWNRQRWIVAVGQVILQVFLKPSLQSETAVTSGAIRKSNAKYAVVVSLRVTYQSRILSVVHAIRITILWLIETPSTNTIW